MTASLLALDIGNTHTVAGLFAVDGEPGADPLAHWRFQTQRTATRDELLIAVRDLVSLDGFELADVEQVVISSVVPVLTATWRGLGERLGGLLAGRAGDGSRGGAEPRGGGGSPSTGASVRANPSKLKRPIEPADAASCSKPSPTPTRPKASAS